MAKHSDDRSPAEIEGELEHTRAQIDRTIDAIQSRMAPGQIFQEFYDLARGGSTDYVRNLGLAARNNPVPVALVAVGLTWLATSGGRTPSYLRGSHVPRGEHAHGGGESWSGAAGRAVANATDKVGEQAGSIVERAGDVVSGTTDRVRQMADDARNLASEWGEDARGAAATSRARMRDAGGAAQDMTARLRDRGGELWRDQPLIVGAVGLAVGALLGALLPSTEQEDAVMGETRDKLVDQARALGEGALHGATETATDMADAATQAVADRATVGTEAGAGSAAVSPETTRKDGGTWQ
jgi:ElaB/YqjD/DUF883 family membrane-anchored ribosome-binding protein